MLALTLWRPWAQAVVAGPKDIENRDWEARRLRPGDVFAIHAGARFQKAALERILVLWPECPRLEEQHPMGIVGLVEYLGCVTPEQAAPNPWAFGSCCWQLGRRMALEVPYPMKGAMALWPIPEAYVSNLRAEWAARFPAP